MSENTGYAGWNPWHGCTKISAGCRYCYVYRQDEMYGTGEGASLCRRNAAFDLPIRKRRDGGWKIPGRNGGFYLFYLRLFAEGCGRMAAGLLGDDAQAAGLLVLLFYQAHRPAGGVLPPDWGEGYENVIIGCTVENQDRADARLPLLLELPIRAPDRYSGAVADRPRSAGVSGPGEDRGADCQREPGGGEALL